MKTIAHYQTSVGEIAIAEIDGFITDLYLKPDRVPADLEICETPLKKEAFRQLESYLRGESDLFTVPLAPAGTPFMQKVWEKLRAIPYGTTASYKEIAANVCSPKAARAVGLANNRNPIPIFIPCHRVIGANGKLVGYRSGLALKEKLLHLEKSNAFFEYGQAEINHLKKRDKKLGLAIDRIGTIRRKITPDLFTALIGNIVGQQISGKAARSIWEKLVALLGEVTPERVAAADTGDIQKCGVSAKKAGYIKNIGQAALSGEIDFAGFAAMSDDEVIKKLSSLNGVGVWTAEMLLIFSMRRPDVLSWGDLAIMRGMMNLYGLKTLDREQFEKYRKRYSPYGTVASLYLWALSAE